MLDKIYVLILSASFLASVYNWRHIYIAEKVIAFLLLFSLANELLCRYLLYRNLPLGVAHNVFSVFEILLTTAFFLLVVNYRNVLFKTIGITIVWLIIIILNSIFYNPYNYLNINVLVLESVYFIGLSLYVLYNMLLDDNAEDLFRNSLFSLVCLQLILWGGSFMFWSLGIYLINNNINATAVNNYHIILNILVYFGFFIVYTVFGKLKLT